MAPPREPAAGDRQDCYHCGLEVDQGVDLTVELGGVSRAMCCIGCLAVAETLKMQGLEHWYETREAPTGEPAQLVPDILDRSEFLQIEEETSDEGDAEAGGETRTFLVGGMTCAACAWLVERHLGTLDGVEEARVATLSHRVRIRWNPARVALRDIVARLAEIGFVARPDEPDDAVLMARAERRSALIRVGIAGLATMNVMTYAVALYAGEFDGMSPATQALLRWLCWLVATPVVFISAAPFFEGALRELKVRRPGMDVPVALAIGGAYLASAWAVVIGEGQVYFESVCMFTLFLGVTRFVEMSGRHRAAARCRQLLDSAPAIARRVEDGHERVISSSAIRLGDQLAVRQGEAVPVDGLVLEGRSTVEEALLTGEPWPRRIEAGDEVHAGSLVGEAPLLIEARSTARDSTLSSLVHLIEAAQTHKPRVARWADRVATIFVSAVLLGAVSTGAIWSVVDPDRALWVTLSVLVATCPCALGLATPAAIAASAEALARVGFVVTRADALEALAGIDTVVFDKTGTLTEGRPELVRVVPLRAETSSALIEKARLLEASSNHVLARAFGSPSRDESLPEVVHVLGHGVEGKLDARRVRLGDPRWVIELTDDELPPGPVDRLVHTWILMGDEFGALAWFGLGDRLRETANESIEALDARGLSLELLSGDPSREVAEFARSLGLRREVEAALPEQKVERIRSLRAGGAQVAFLGDGLNDGPVMRAADVSIAMASGCDLTRSNADVLLWSDDLRLLPEAIDWARRTRRVIRQNFIWAIGYNLCALPIAATGHLAPWAAALGMSLSSLVVVANSARLRKRKRAL